MRQLPGFPGRSTNHCIRNQQGMSKTPKFVTLLVVTGPDRARPSLRWCIIWWSPTAFSMRILQTYLVRLLPTPWHQTERKTKAFERTTTVRHKCRDKKGKGKTKRERKTGTQRKEPYPTKP